MSNNDDMDAEELAIRQWRVKKLIDGLEKARGNGTSMISLIIPPRDQIARISKMLTDEYGTASNIKSRVNRLSVLNAITSTVQKLKLFTRVPANGLVVYCGTILTEEGKEKKVNYAFEPHKPINTSLYLCDNVFHVEALKSLLESDDKFGFIIMDGSGTLYGTLSGNTREILYKFTVDLPKKHGRGGQSSVRFARLRLEKRHNYVRKVSEVATQLFIKDNMPNVTGLILGGLADFKNDLNNSDMFDPRLKKVVIQIVDCSYGFENGFNQAIELASETLSNVKFIQEKRLISKFFEEIALDTGRVSYGVKESLYALENGAVHTLIVFENLDITRYVMGSGDKEKIVYLRPDQLTDTEHYKDKDGQNYEIKDSQLLVEWFAENFKKFGATLQFVSDKSQEGSQFVQGFGGVGGLLRYKFDLSSIEYTENDGLNQEDDDNLNEDDWDIFY
jgi:peptide chain release factor subunit 1